MKTNNFYNIVKLYALSAYVDVRESNIVNKYPIYIYNGNQLLYNTSVIKDSIICAIYNMCPYTSGTKSSGSYLDTRNAVPYGESGDSGFSADKKYFMFGSGTTNESINDYALANRLDKNSIRTLVTTTVDEDGVASSSVTITNVSNAQIQINEIGLFISGSYTSAYSRDSNVNSTAILLERRVLSSPVIIEPNESVTLIIKTGLEEDLEATVVNP